MVEIAKNSSKKGRRLEYLAKLGESVHVTVCGIGDQHFVLIAH